MNNSELDQSTLKEIPPLMPMFLQRRRVGVAAPRVLAEQVGIEPVLLFTMVQLSLIQGSYGGEHITPAQAREWSRYTYSSRDHLMAHLAALEAKKLVMRDEEGRFTLTPGAFEVVEAVHMAGKAHVAGLQPLPQEELEELARQLERAVQAVLSDPVLAPRRGSHLAGSRTLVTTGPVVPVMVRIEQAIYDLWLARDDAHVKAWREADLEGPAVRMLTVLWSGETESVNELTQILKPDQTPEDVETTMAYLFDKDYLVREGDEVRLTPTGVLAREDIERDTDRVYFASWPHIEVEALWIRSKLGDVVANIGSR